MIENMKGDWKLKQKRKGKRGRGLENEGELLKKNIKIIYLPLNLKIIKIIKSNSKNYFLYMSNLINIFILIFFYN